MAGQGNNPGIPGGAQGSGPGFGFGAGSRTGVHRGFSGTRGFGGRVKSPLNREFSIAKKCYTI
jgi:hypothetical protein